MSFFKNTLLSSSNNVPYYPRQLSDEAIKSLTLNFWMFAASIEECTEQLDFDFRTHALDDAILVSTATFPGLSLL